MANNQGSQARCATKIVDQLRRAAVVCAGATLTDGQLLDAFIDRRDEAAFAVLVRKHGPMVWGVCRRVLHDHHDAEDAFQATFLVLVRKAASIVPRDMLANWLYGVANRTALKAKTTVARRRARESQSTVMPEPQAANESLWHDLEPLLDQELQRLPDKYRVAVVLCDLEGKSRKEAARQLRIPEGTLSSRLTTARSMLARRLARHSPEFSGAALAAVLAQNAMAAGVPTPVVSSTIKAAALLAAGQAAGGLISAKAAALSEGVLKAMLLTKLKVAMAVVLVGSALGLSTGPAVYRAFAQETRKTEKKNDPTLADESNAAKADKRESKVGLPTGPAPSQAVVGLDQDGQLVVRMLHSVYEPAVSVREGQNVVRYKVRETVTTRQYKIQNIKVYEVNGKAIDTKDLSKLLKEEIPALVIEGVPAVDPLHLRLFKEGTLLFVLPLSQLYPVAQAADVLVPQGVPVQEVPGAPPDKVPQKK